jgi:hypothetical protein
VDPSKWEVFRLWAKLESEPKAAREVTIYTESTQWPQIQWVATLLSASLPKCGSVQKSQNHVGM